MTNTKEVMVNEEINGDRKLELIYKVLYRGPLVSFVR